jgi:hypothetical protein
MIKLFEKFLHDNNAKYLISILIGLGIATIFRKACKNDDCYIFKGPYSSEIKDKIYSFNNKCYKFIPKTITCNSKQKQVKFA